MDPVRVMQISACFVEPLGVAAFGRLYHHPELLRVHEEESLTFWYGAACPVSTSGTSASQGRDGTAEKDAIPIPPFTSTAWKQGAVQRLWDEETQLPPCTVLLYSHLCYLLLSLALLAWTMSCPMAIGCSTPAKFNFKNP